MATFTMEDAENDGRIKREVGSELAKVLKREGGQLWRMFINVCENQGREPKIVLGEGIVKALNDEGFSEQIADVEIDMTQLRSGELRKEDARFVKELRNEFKEEDDNDMGFVDDLVKQRLKAKTESPIPSMGRRGAADKETQQEIQELKQQVDRIASEVSGANETVDTSDQKKDLDDIFSGSSDSESGDATGESEQTVGVEEQQVQDNQTAEETSSEDTAEVEEQQDQGRTKIEPENHDEESGPSGDEGIVDSVEISDHGGGEEIDEDVSIPDMDEDNGGMTANGTEIKGSSDAVEEGDEDE